MPYLCPKSLFNAHCSLHSLHHHQIHPSARHLEAEVLVRGGAVRACGAVVAGVARSVGHHVAVALTEHAARTVDAVRQLVVALVHRKCACHRNSSRMQQQENGLKLMYARAKVILIVNTL